jgi:hypothetical protein
MKLRGERIEKFHHGETIERCFQDMGNCVKLALRSSIRFIHRAAVFFDAGCGRRRNLHCRLRWPRHGGEWDLCRPWRGRKRDLRRSWRGCEQETSAGHGTNASRRPPPAVARTRAGDLHCSRRPRHGRERDLRRPRQGREQETTPVPVRMRAGPLPLTARSRARASSGAPQATATGASATVRAPQRARRPRSRA